MMKIIQGYGAERVNVVHEGALLHVHVPFPRHARKGWGKADLPLRLRTVIGGQPYYDTALHTAYCPGKAAFPRTAQ